MSSFAGSSNSPAMLKVAKWDHLPLHVKPSELSDVSLSPSRKLLLLHSYQYEAFLFPLTAESLGYRSIPVERLAEYGQTSNGASCKVFDSCAIISNVKSFVWGCYLDTYSHFERSDYIELLAVCNDNGIVFHVFGPYTELDKTKFGHDGTPLQGNWVEWGPSCNLYGKEQIQDVHGCQIQFGDARFPNSSLEQKNWLRTFLCELDASWSGSRYLAKFPTKLSYPHYAVLSFEVSYTTTKFLESYAKTRSCYEAKQGTGVLMTSMDNAPLLDNKSDPLPWGGVLINNSYKCSRVFSGSLNNLIGLVLITSPEHSSVRGFEVEVKREEKTFVVVIMLDKWGLEWTCAIDIEEPCSGLGPSPRSKWADFQFLDSFLLCLDTSGLTWIWCAKTGSPVACFDVVGCCKVNAKVFRPSCQFNLPGKDGARNESMRAFTKLMVAPYSFLLAAADEHGVIYVVDANEYISGYLHVPNKTISLSRKEEVGMLDSWNVAGRGIGCQKVLSDVTSNKKNTVSQPGRTISKHIHDKESNLNSFRSAYSTRSQGKTLESSLELSTRMRRVFFPPGNHSNEGSICFSAFGVTRLVRNYGEMGEEINKIFHTDLHFSTVFDDRHLGDCFLYRSHCVIECYVGECIGFSFKGLLYVVSQEGLFVILPSVSYSCSVLSAESERHRQTSTVECGKYELNGLLVINEPKEFWKPWQMEVFDRTLSFEGPEEAENICLMNGWDFRVARLRRMQYGLHYRKYDYIKESLDMLVDVNLAEEGILHLLFTSVYLLFCKVGCDNEVSFATRLLHLAACFATKMIRKYGLAQHKKDHFFSVHKDFRGAYVWHLQHSNKLGWINISQRLSEMSRFLEVIRNVQSKLSSKDRRLLVDADGKNKTNLVDSEILPDESVFPVVGFIQSQDMTPLLPFDKIEDLSISLEESFSSSENFNAICVPESGPSARRLLSLENPKETIARWKMDNLDLKTVVKDALHFGRLPLAVLQLHLRHHGAQMDAKEHYDTFTEVCEAGKAIAYELFMKGEGTLALETLLRLGEDTEGILRQLLLGTVRRSLRAQIAEAMKSYGYLRTQEWKILQGISLIERLYPSSNFWSTFHGKQKDRTSSTSSLETSEIELKFHVNQNFVIECGEVDGTILTSWVNEDDGPSSGVDDDNAHAGYWVCAAAWADAWDQRTIDRVVLDRSISMNDISWESQLEYHLSHNNLVEVHKLLDVIPSYLLSEGTLKVNLDHSISNVGINFPDYPIYICATEEVEPVCLFIPNIKVFKFSVGMCSSWLKVLVETKLARKQIFLKDYWESTAELIPLVFRSGLIFSSSKGFINSNQPVSFLDSDVLEVGEYVQNDTADALHKLIIHYCTQYNFPHFLDLYLDNLNLVYDDDIFYSLHEAAGDCEWAKWLLLLRVKGCEYDASFCNARSNLSKQVALARNLSVHGVDELIHTVDDMAEGGGEMAALATLMHASVPMQKCICTGSISRHCSSSSQCTLESLRPGLQKFPTLWRTLVSACFGMDFCGGSKSSNADFEKSALSDYLRWRDAIFSSAGGDASLVQMLPCWFPKSIRRLIRLFVQVPLGWKSLSSAIPSDASNVFQEKNYALASNIHGVNSVTWEIAIQKSVEELHSSFESGSVLEQHLHRRRALGAFNNLLSLRASKLKDATEYGKPSRQNNVQSDVQTMLSPLSQNELPLIQSVIRMAIMHFDDSALVASCTFLLELCGLSASMLRTDVAALMRISDFYNKQNTHCDASPRGSSIRAKPFEGDITYSLARALVDICTHHDIFMESNQKNVPSKISKGKQPLQPLMVVLQHLEKASLPSLEEGKTCGSWLSSNIGDGFEFRLQQKDASLHWKLVMEFCRIHHLPLSTKFLALLAKDNDWVGFLMEAQIWMFPVDAVIKVATKEFSNPRLKMHILTVLRSMQSTKKKSSSSLGKSSGSGDTVLYSDSFTMVPELFGLIALCEKQKNPGETLLVKAKDLRWSPLAMIASCFSDVSPLTCLTVWLEITAARETSSIKVNDVSSKVAENVKAAVEATNKLHSACTTPFHYNRRNPKRRRLLEPAFDSYVTNSSNLTPNSVISMTIYVTEETMSNDLEASTVARQSKVYSDPEEALASLSTMVAVLCEQHLFLPLLRAFEMFLPSCSLLPFIRSLQAFSQMRLSEASVHLSSFSTRIKDEALYMPRDGKLRTPWISTTAAKAAEAMLLTCPSAYEKRCLLQLLAATDFGDGGSTSTYFQRLYWKINLAEPSLRKDADLYLGNEILDDASLLAALENNGRWDQARNWARQLENSGASWKYAAHHVTETQAEAMVAEWKEFLWDVPEERVALWTYCNTLFVRHFFPALQAGLFFLRHADAVEKEIPARELHEMLLLALQWLSGSITQCHPVYPLYLLREIETRVWLLAVESEAQAKTESDYNIPSSTQNVVGIIEQTASIIEKMDDHLNAMQLKLSERSGTRDNSLQFNRHSQPFDLINPDATMSGSSRMKRRTKVIPRRSADNMDSIESDDSPNSPHNFRCGGDPSKSFPLQEENVKIEASISGWEDKVKPADMERAVLSLLEFGQLTAAKQLQHKLSPEHVPSELAVVDAALKVAAFSSSCSNGGIRDSMLDEELTSFFQSLKIDFSNYEVDAMQVLESLSTKCNEGRGRGLCLRIIAVVKAAKALGLTFSEAFEKRPIELLQLLSLKAQDSFEEAQLLVKTHFMLPASIAKILAESFLKGLLAAHRGGYMDSQTDEGPSPLLWRFSDFLKWAELCPSEQEIGHALMRLVMTGQEIPHACEVELLILSHHFYKSSACLDGVDVLVTLAANRVESYVSEGDFSCLARLVTGVSNFHALNFILNILIENGQLELLLSKYSIADSHTDSDESVQGFRIAVLTSLRAFCPNDFDQYAKVYTQFDMKHETASLLESRSLQRMHSWLSHRERDRRAEELLESMRYLIEASEVYASVDAGHKTHSARARAALLSLQIRIPDFIWIELSDTNARRVLVDLSRFQEALIVAEAYNLNQPSEWTPVLWNQMLKPGLIEQFITEFVAILPLQPSMLLELARFYKAEVAARGEQSHFSVWLSPGGLPAERMRHMGRSFRSLLRRTRDLRLRVQLATIATGFADVINACMKGLDKVPDNGAPLLLRRSHGGVYVPLM